MMFWYDHDMSGWGYAGMAIGMVLFWALIIGGIVALVRYASGDQSSRYTPPVGITRPTTSPRRSIFKRLADGPLAVGELAHGLPVSRPAVSQHLKVLKCAGLVSDRAVGRQRMYQVNPEGIEALRSELDVFWGRALDAYKLIADEGRQDG